MMRERLGENCAKIENDEQCTEIEIGGTLW